MRNAAVKKLFELARSDRNIILMTGDLGYGVLDEFRQNLAGQFFNAGICEQNMTAVAAGLALEGKIVFTYSIANFPSLRCLEQIRDDAAYHHANVKIMSVGAGLAYGSLGMSHHATEDIAVMRALPDVTVFSPSGPAEAVKVCEAACAVHGPCYIRLGKGKEKDISIPPADYQIGQAVLVQEGSDVCLFATGAILSEAYQAAAALNEQNISTALYSFPTVKPLDVDLIRTKAASSRLLVTVEEGNILGGFGGAVAEVLAEMPNRKAFLKRIGLNDTYAHVVGNQDYLRDYYGLSAEKIARAVQTVWDGKK